MRADESRPEPVLFLLEAADAMVAYRRLHETYATEWRQLDISFAAEPYREGEPGTRPRETDGPSWRPKGCDYTYWIVSADRDDYQIEARTKEGVAAYEMRPGMEEPCQLAPSPEDTLCTQEEPRGKDIGEAVVFLGAAAEAFAVHHRHYGAYPEAWEALEFHWALVEHGPDDPGVKPPPGTGRAWRPRGASYTYEIVFAGKDEFEVRSRNDLGLQDFSVSSSDHAPVSLQR